MLIESLTKEEYDWLVGLFLADGSRYFYKRGYCLYFYLSPFKDKEILKKLLLILKKMGFKPAVEIKKTINTLCVRFFSKELFGILPRKYEVYYPKAKDAFVAGFLDGDGYIQKYQIGFSQKVVKWIGPYIHDYLMKLGVKSWFTYYRKMFYLRCSLKDVKQKTRILEFMAKK